MFIHTHTHASMVVKSGDADQLSLLDWFSWLIPVPALFFLFGRNCVPWWQCHVLPFPRCQERQGADPSPRVPRRVRALPSVPSRQLLLPLVASRARSVPQQGWLLPSPVPAEVLGEAGLAAGLCTPWPGPLTLGIPPRAGDVGPALALIPGQPQRGLCLLNLNISGHLQVCHRADHLNPSSCTCWGWSCWE